GRCGRSGARAARPGAWACPTSWAGPSANWRVCGPPAIPEPIEGKEESMPLVVFRYFWGASTPAQALMLAGFLLWLAAYLLILLRAARHKTFGLPGENNCLNLAWEFLLGVVCPLSHAAVCPVTTGVEQILLLGWLVLDGLNFLLLVAYGRPAKLSRLLF